MMQVRCSRDSVARIDNDGELVKIDDFLDYQSQMYFMSDKNIDVYNETRKKSLLALMKRVMEYELTNRQRDVVILVKGMQLKQHQAGEMLGISKSTVSRHLKSAQKKFDKAYKHFELNQTHRAE